MPISFKVKLPLGADTGVGMSQATAAALAGMAKGFQKIKPDLVVVLGDRYETFAAGQAALMLRIPVAHLHGGETTEGAMDEAFRHGLTKLAQLHFVAAGPYRKRVIQMGEDPKRVHLVGAIGVDNIRQLRLLSKAELEKAIDSKLGRINFLITFHPATLSKILPEVALKELLSALDQFPKARLFFTQANADPGGQAITRIMKDYVKRNSHRASFHTSLGQVRYLSLMKHCSVVIGNSSSGVFEAPYLGVPTVNIGDRQKGRLIPASVINCPDSRAAIVRSIKTALDPTFAKKLRKMKLPFGSGNAAAKIRGIISRTDLGRLQQKGFHDL